MTTSENLVATVNGLLQKLNSGQPVPDVDRVSAFKELVETRMLRTYVHLLPLILNLEGQPFTLNDHFAFESLFHTRLTPEITLKTGRQTGKSQSIAARGVTLCNALPNFSLLYVTPLYEQIRRFSTQYVRPLVDQSPMRGIWTSTGTENSVLQRSFTNNSKMYFSFAYLDADRLRGISAKGGVSIDESVSFKSLIQTDGGDKPVTDLNTGDVVRAYNDEGKVVWDVVVSKSYHGRRACFRIHTSDGRAVTATAESLVATTAGWKHVSEIIKAATGRPDPAPPGDATGGRVSELENDKTPSVPQPARLVPARVQPGQMGRVAGVHKIATRKAEELRLRGMVEHLRHADVPGIRLFGSPVLSERPQGSEPGLAGSPDLGGCCLVVRGRRESDSRPDDAAAHGGLHSAGSGTPGGVADVARRAGQDVDLPSEGPQHVPPGYPAVGERLPSGGVDWAAPARVDGLQAADERPSRLADVLRVSGSVCSTEQSVEVRGEACRQDGTVWRVLLPAGTPPAQAGGVRPEGARDNEVLEAVTRPGQGRGDAAAEESALYRVLPAKPGRLSGESADGGHQAAGQPGVAGGAQPQAAGGSGTCTGSRGDACCHLPAVSGAVCPDDAQGYRPALLSAVSVSRPAGDFAEVRVESEGGEAGKEARTDVPSLWKGIHGHDTERRADGDLLYLLPPGEDQSEAAGRLLELEIVGFEFVGVEDVYDIETALYHTFFADGVAVHNCQDMDPMHIPIIMETMSAAKDWGIKTFTGTPKTLDGTLETFWGESSQAEWVTTCPRCGKDNVPAMGYDLEKMIGPYSPNISEDRPGTICANPQCRKPINPRTGRWWHRYPEKRWSSPGYHVPQIIMPMHYAKPNKWLHLLGKQQGSGNTTTAMFYNEVLGESYDVGTKLVNLPDLQAAAILPWRNIPEAPIEVLSRLRDYTMRILSVDWGGGGEKRVSFTTAAVLGVRPDGKLDVIYGRRLLTPHDHLREARELLGIFSQFDCHLFAHDYTGAGDLRETFMIQVGLPLNRIAPVAYVGAARQGILVAKPATETRPRNYWQLDKTRSLVLVCACIKLKRILFFQDDYQNKDNPGLLRDFLALIENKAETNGAGELYQIIRASSHSDDFAHSVNIGACIAWQTTNTWPDLARDAGVQNPGAFDSNDDDDNDYWN